MVKKTIKTKKVIIALLGSRAVDSRCPLISRPNCHSFTKDMQHGGFLALKGHVEVCHGVG
jgi:hypothetical protein